MGKPGGGAEASQLTKSPPVLFGDILISHHKEGATETAAAIRDVTRALLLRVWAAAGCLQLAPPAPSYRPLSATLIRSEPRPTAPCRPACSAGNSARKARPRVPVCIVDICTRRTIMVTMPVAWSDGALQQILGDLDYYFKKLESDASGTVWHCSCSCGCCRRFGVRAVRQSGAGAEVRDGVRGRLSGRLPTQPRTLAA